MYSYGRKWHEALEKVLRRLALDDGHGFLVLEGPKGCGKSDLIKVIVDITKDMGTAKRLENDEARELAQKVFARRYVTVSLGNEAGYVPNIPVHILNCLFETIGRHALLAGQRFLLTWDDIDDQVAESHRSHEFNREFLEEIHRPLEMYRHVTLLASVTCLAGGGGEVLGISGGPGHFLALAE